MYKTSLFLVLAVCAVVSQTAPAERADPLAQLLASSGDSGSRTTRQSQEPMSPLSQLLQDALNIPQVALQAVSRLLTNPRNSIGQSTSRSSFNN